MARLFGPVRAKIFKDETGAPHWLTVEDWFPKDTSVVGTENRSLEMKLLPILIRHIDTHARKIAPKTEKICITLDGHSSRNGWEWLELCLTENTEVVQSPANTSHFLQPCDNQINKTFKRTIRKTVDYLSQFSVLDTASVGIKLKLGVVAYRSLISNVAAQSFQDCGMWPLDYRFVKDAAEREKVQTSANAMQSVAVNRQDRSRIRQISQVLHENPNPCAAIASITKVLSDHNRIENILDKYTTDNREHNMTEKRVVTLKLRDAFSTGTPALYLTHGHLTEKRKQRDIDTEEARKQNTADKERKLLEREECRRKKEEEARVRKERRELRKMEAARAKASQKAWKKARRGPKDISATPKPPNRELCLLQITLGHHD